MTGPAYLVGMLVPGLVIVIVMLHVRLSALERRLDLGLKEAEEAVDV